MKFETDGYFIGLDPPATANIGWAVFKYYSSMNAATYVSSGHDDIEGQIEKKRMLNIKKFLEAKHADYDPIHVYCVERAIGQGRVEVREKLGENTGIIKLTAYEHDSLVACINTNHMFKNLGVSKKDSDKKIETCRKIIDMFPSKLSEKKVSKSGSFTHESDAIGFIISFCLDHNISIFDEKGIVCDND